MKINVYTIDIETPRWLRKAIAYVVPVALVCGAGALAYADVPTIWKSGDPLKAADLNENFQDLDGRVGALEANGYYTETSGGATTAGEGIWTDIPGLQVTFTTKASAKVELFTVVSMTATGGPSSCAIRFVLDSSPVGDWEAIGEVNPPWVAIPGLIQLTGLRQIPIAAGQHTASVQFEKNPGVYAGTNCVVGGSTYGANGRFRAVVK